MGKKISIITVCYNSSKTIEATIKSVLSQKNEYIEYIIVDGKSTDDTMRIVNKYKNLIDVIISEKDSGISEAFNKGIRIATGEWIGIINSDDQYISGAFNKLLMRVEPQTDIFYGNGIRAYKNGTFKRYLANPDYNKLHKHMCLVHPATFVKKSAYERFGNFDTSFKAVMDRNLLLKMLKGGAKFQYDRNYYAIYSMGGESDKNYFKYVLPEDERIDRNDDTTVLVAKFRRLKSALIYIAVKYRNWLGLNRTEKDIDIILKEQEL